MQRILQKIKTESQKLENSQLCLWLQSDTNHQEDRLSFAPSMLFFVLGFKDMLTVMRVEDPQSDIDYEINLHCEEDLDHWKWYLRDLEQLGFIPQSWGSRMGDIFKQIWGDDSFEVRNLVYTVISETKKHNNPLISLIMIEYLEAAFAVFIRNMLVPIRQMGYYEQLQYFGKLHVEKETAHSRGAWVDGDRSEPGEGFKHHLLNEKTLSLAESIVDKVSGQMLNVFDYWYSSRNNFIRFSAKDSKIAFVEEEAEFL